MAYVPHKIGALMQMGPNGKKEAKAIIVDAYKRNGANGELAAHELGTTRRTLGRWINALNLADKLTKLRDSYVRKGAYRQTSTKFPRLAR